MHSFIWMSNIPLYICNMPSLSIHLLMDIYVASNVLAIINSAAMNTVVHVSFFFLSFSIMAFLGYMPGSGIVRSYVSFGLPQ